MSNFRIGDKVECVDFRGSTGWHLRNACVPFFTILDTKSDSAGKQLLHLQEIGTYAFADRFSPYQTSMEPEESLEDILQAQEIYRKIEGSHE